MKAIRNYTKPVTARDLCRFLGMLNFYRSCIPRAAELQAPLHEMLHGCPRRSKKPVVWTPATDKAFEACKQSIVTAVRASFIAPFLPLILSADVSSTQIGANQDQLVDGDHRVIGLFLRKLSDTETRYSTYDRELLAIFAAVKHFQRILEGREFVIRTDHRPLIYAAQQRSDKASPRQQRQLDFILQFQVTFQHDSGKDNIVADALSHVCTIDMPTRLTATALSAAQKDCPELPYLLEAAQPVLQQLDIEDNTLYCNIANNIVRPYVPVALRRMAFDMVHGLSHPSRRSTSRLLAQKFYWPDIRKNAARWSRNCGPCQKSKVHRHNRAALGDFATPDNGFDDIHVDIVKMPLVRDKQYCLTVIDRFSRWPTALPMADMHAETVAKALVEGWICMFGTPRMISSDQGTQFESALFTALSNLIGAQRTRTTPYHPQANGMVERFHRTLKAALMSNPHIPWPDALPTVLLGLRTAFKDDLQASPAEMLFGTTLRIPGEFFVTSSNPASAPGFVSKLRQLIASMKAVPAARHTQQKPFFHRDLRSCSHIFKRVDTIRRPLDPPYSGPHEVVRRIDDRSYVIVVNGVERTFSTDALKPAYVETAEPGPPPAPPPAPAGPAIAQAASAHHGPSPPSASAGPATAPSASTHPGPTQSSAPA